MNKKIILSVLVFILIFAVTLVLPGNLSAKQVNGVGNQPASNRGQGQGQLQIQSSRKQNNINPTGIETENETETTEIEDDLGNHIKKEKLGKNKLKDLISGIGSPSGKMKNLNRKLFKLELRQSSPSSQLKKRHAVMGVITAISGNIITISHQIKGERIYTIVIGPNTVITGKSSPGVNDGENATSSGSVQDLKVGERIAAFGKPQPDGSLLADKIHIIAGKAIGVFKRISGTPEISPSSTPSSEVTTLTPTSGTVSPTVEITPTLTPAV